MQEYPPCIYHPLAGRFTKWFCTTHKRDADHICINPRGRITVCCAPWLGGITIPCDCKRVEIDEAA
jgi:hypothetical protein